MRPNPTRPGAMRRPTLVLETLRTSAILLGVNGVAVMGDHSFFDIMMASKENEGQTMRPNPTGRRRSGPWRPAAASGCTGQGEKYRGFRGLTILNPLDLVYMAYSERLPTRLSPLAERTCFSQVRGAGQHHGGRAGHGG
jgi:hypothetical protein